MTKQLKLYSKNKTAYNTGLAKVAVQCSADPFVLNQSLVLRINICGENRHLRQARIRWAKSALLLLPIEPPITLILPNKYS